MNYSIVEGCNSFHTLITPEDMSEWNVYRYQMYVHPVGEISGMFFAHPDDMHEVLDKDVHLGEVLGKYSDITVTFEEEFLELIDFSAATKEELRSVMYQNGTIVGHNPVYEYYMNLHAGE